MASPATAAPYQPTKAKTEDWCTPEYLLAAARDILGTIDLDPCSNPFSIVHASREVMLPKWAGVARTAPQALGTETIFGDGTALAIEWAGNIFFNPPYAHKPMGRFMERAVRLQLARCGSAIGLLPSKTSLEVWHEHVPAAPAVCFLDKRVTYRVPDGPDTNAPFHSALVLWTASRRLVHRFAERLDGQLGDVMFHLGRAA
jgi:ParB family chromosome partitioning protein